MSGNWKGFFHKKSVLILLTFVPIAVGYIVNVSITLPVIGMVVFYILPLLTTVFWFYLGKLYADSAWKTLPALLFGHATGVLSLLIYLWQYLLETDETRNLALAFVSQMFSNSAPVYFLARIAILFETQPNSIGRTSVVALNVLSIIYMNMVFLFGFIWGRKIKK